MRLAIPLTGRLGRPLRRGTAAGVAALLLATLPAACGDPEATAPPLSLVYLDLTGSTAAAKASALRDAGVVVDQVAEERGRLLVDVIDDNPLSHARVVTDQTFVVPEAHGNRLVERRKLAERRAGAMAAIAAMLHGPRPARYTDVFVALAAAAQRLQAFPPSQRRRLVFLSDMVSTAPGRNLGRSTWDRPAIQRLLTELRAEGLLPSLTGVEVWVGGAGLASGNRLSAAKVLQIRSVWLAVFRATGARLTVYGPQLIEVDGGQAT